MSKAVLLSIKPKWCELIANGKKTVEVRKTKPKIEMPFKVYIYCTSSNKHECLMQNESGVKLIYAFDYKSAIPCGGYIANGKVIGEFVCDEITEYEGEFWDDETQESIKKVIHGTDWDGYAEIDYSFIAENGEENHLCKSSCLSWEELRRYMGEGINTFFGWHISDLVIYDKPKELSELYTEGDCDCMNCKICAWFDKGNGYNVEDDCNLAYRGIELHKSFKPITRAPQSWRYVEEDRHDGS